MAEQQLKTSGQEQNLFNGRKLISRAIDYWYLYIIFLAICVSYAWFTVHYATPMYKVYAQVLVQDDKNGGSSSQAALSGNGVDFSSLFSGKVNMDNEIAILQASDICRRVVYSLNLYTNYYHKGSVRAVELYNSSPFIVYYKPDNDTISPIQMTLTFPDKKPSGFTIQVNGKKFDWRFNDTLHYNKGNYCFINRGADFDPNITYIYQVQNPESVAGGIASGLGVSLLTTKSTILNLVYNTNLPQKGEDILGGVVKAYIKRNLEQKNIISDSTIQFINSRILLVGEDLANIETTIQRFKQENKITNLSAQSQQLITNQTDFYQKLNELNVQLQVIKTMLTYIGSEQNNRRPVPALLNADATFTGLVSAYNEAQVQRDKILLSLKPDNPIAANLDVQIAGLRSDLIRSLKSQQTALNISQQSLIVQNNEVGGLIRNVPEKERKFLDYSREQDVKQALYLFLLQRREEIAIAKASNASNISVVSSPRASHTPYEPVSSTALTIGFLLGLTLPTAFVILKFLLNNKVLSREDITDATPATIISEIGHNPNQGVLNLSSEGRSVVAEQFRIFRTNMDFALNNVKSPVIMITSCLSGEGKSFIAANLAQIYSISGKKVLLMELDLRRPKLSGLLGVGNEFGFSNYIISNSPAETFIKHIDSLSTRMDILSSGPIPPNPAELLASDKMGELVQYLKTIYDVIIIDTAPIGAVTDAQILGKHADVSLYIVRQNYSIKNSIEIINDIILNSKLPNLYVVLNDIVEGASYKYGYGYRYGYGYSYNNSVKEKKKWWQLGSRLKTGKK